MNERVIDAIRWLSEEWKMLPYDSEYKTLLIVAIDALDRRIPKKPKHTKGVLDKSGWKKSCPVCGCGVGQNENDSYAYSDERDYCENCGQRLDWRDNDSIGTEHYVQDGCTVGCSACIELITR